METVRVVSEKKEVSVDGKVILKVEFSCGCKIYHVVDFDGTVHDPMWLRCPRHKNARAEDIIVMRE
jgi:hypothetical protein